MGKRLNWWALVASLAAAWCLVVSDAANKARWNRVEL